MSRPTDLDLNQASEDQLVRKLKIPARLAQRIIRMRPYHTPADLQRIWGLDDPLRARLTALLSGEALPAEPAPDVPMAVPIPREPRRISWVTTLALLGILLVGAWLRLSNLNWDANTHQNPDERFMTIVAARLQPVEPGAYFDTAASTLNPFQAGASYTYGMLPLFLTRMVGGWLNSTKYDQVVLVGRALSSLFDLAALLLLFLLGRMLFDRRVGLLAAGLYAVAVFPIQMAHFFTVDSFATVFILAGFIFAYQAVPLLPGRGGRISLLYFGLFGLSAGLAMACKVNAAVFFGVIGLAALAHAVSAWRDKPARKHLLLDLLKGLALAAAVGFAAFRIANPYTFLGPGIFNLQINPRWLSVISEVTGQVAGKSEWPPNHHWTSRGPLYAWLNMVGWGMGWPLGLAAWAAWGYALWRCFKGEWRRLLLPVAWVGGYFLWQNMQFWRYMRYFLPVYPLLILLAAWGLIRLWDGTRAARASLWSLRLRGQPAGTIRRALPGLAAVLALFGVIAYTALYAWGFTGIYRQPITRVAASNWMLQTIRAPFNLVLDTAGGPQSYPIAAPASFTYARGESYHSSFIPRADGSASRVETVRVRLALADLRVKLYTGDAKKTFLGEGFAVLPPGDPRESLVLTLPAVTLETGKPYTAVYTFKVNGPAQLGGALLGTDRDTDPTLAQDWSLTTTGVKVLTGSWDFTPAEELLINRLTFTAFSAAIDPASARVQVKLTADDPGDKVLAAAQTTLTFTDGSSSAAPVFTFTDPVPLQAGTTYFVRYQVLEGGPLIFEPEPYALETRWDDSLPLGIPPYNIGGIYAPYDLKLYEPDTEVKRQAMLSTLEQVTYLVLPSNRAYDAMPRLTLRYPLTTAYYQALFGCNCAGDDMEALAARLETGFHSPLGFDLVAVFTRYPALGPFTLNDQLADESFTVYDHPKVMIFKKSADFSIEKVKAVLGAVDLSQVVFQKPIDVSRNPTGYQMPADRLAAQQANGTWSQLFNLRALVNTSQPFGVVAWYLLAWLLSLTVLPLVLTVFRALPDRGYPLARVLALLLAAWLTWLLASLKLVPFTRLAILGAVLLIAAANAWLAYRRRAEFKAFLTARWRHLLAVEALFLVLFGLGLLLRLGDPDLWQPWTGGEKPMNLALFNEILKSTWFPPLHPWLSGYYLNYYYFGYVLAAIPTKLLGIEPAFAYNLVLPTWFAMTGVGIFSAASNLALKLTAGNGTPAGRRPWSERRITWTAGLAAVVLMLVLGNLYPVGQLWERLPVVANVDQPDTLTGISRLAAAVNGAARVIRGEAELPGSLPSWYFDPSRPILNGGKDTPIAEFPLFTYLYGDMHPHLLVMPLLFAALSWLLALFFDPVKPRLKLEPVLFWLAGGVILGSFRAANTWDYVTLIGLGVVAVGWTSWQAARRLDRASLIDFALKAGLLLLLSYGLYYPFGRWFITGYNSVTLWQGSRTPPGDYLSVHAVFLFVLVSYLLLESAPGINAWLGRWKTRNDGMLIPAPKVWLRWAVIIGVAGVIGYVIGRFVPILPLVLVLLVWIGLVFFKRGQMPAKQLVLALFAAGLALTLAVEVFTLKGDIGRMNMVFKLYMQVWALFSLAGGAALAVLLRNWRSWIPEWRWPWAVMLGLLVLGGLSYALTAIPARFKDRWPDIAHPPVTLNGMDYMLGEAANVRPDYDPAQGAVYDDNGAKLHLGYDYAGIRFMQENVSGTPTIVEGIRGEYRWTGRYSVYTGLPAVASWSWHVRQHLSMMDPAIVDQRIKDVQAFYDTADPAAALDFLQRYHVSYIILGDMERAYSAPEGMDKFSLLVQQGKLKEVFRLQGSDGGIQIFQVESPR